MIGGRRSLVNELIIIINRIDRLDRDDPMRVTEEQALVAVLIRERRRSAVPLGEGAFAQLAAPGGPMAPPAQPGPSGAQRDPRRRPPPTSSAPGPNRPISPQSGPSGTQGDVQQVKDLHRGPQGPRVDLVVPHLASLTSSTVTADADEEEEMDKAPASPSPNVGEDGSSDGAEMDTDDEDAILHTGQSDHSRDGFEHF